MIEKNDQERWERQELAFIDTDKVEPLATWRNQGGPLPFNCEKGFFQQLVALLFLGVISIYFAIVIVMSLFIIDGY